MSQEEMAISGTGSALVDYLYSDVDFSSPVFQKYISKKTGDGGLYPGRLVFTEELEQFAQKEFDQALRDIVGNRAPDSYNIGGPGIVSLIHASQMLNSPEFKVKFYGAAGNDKTSERIFNAIHNCPLDTENYHIFEEKYTPFTNVFSDPNYNQAHGERTFVNNIGAAWAYTPNYLPLGFFNSDIICFGGTAIVPYIHDNLAFLLKKGKQNNCITIVNTVFDFRNEKKFPGKRWPLGENDESFQFIDVLIMDQEEALKISGARTIEEAIHFYINKNVSSFIITQGSDTIIAWSDGSFFEKTKVLHLPVSELVTEEIRNNPQKSGDTTGCGDNFVGGVIASIAWQRQSANSGLLDLIEACAWGVSSGGYTCFYMGGTYHESSPGEKLNKIKPYYNAYKKQIQYLNKP